MRGTDGSIEIETVRRGAVFVSDLRFAVCVLIFVRTIDLDDLALAAVHFVLLPDRGTDELQKRSEKGKCE